MGGKILFAFGFHNHQPVGNFDFVIEDAYKKSYLPLLKAIEQFPEMRLSLHNSGILWDWFEENEPAYIEKVLDLVQRGQLEILSGGYYEPIMSVIPHKTRKWQLMKMNSYISRNFGQDPQGMWLAERVWEPHLTENIAKVGLKYIIIDDTHFRCAGLSEEETLGYYLTEEQNLVIAAFPINAHLRYTIPFQDPSVTLDYFKKIRRPDRDVVVVMADDGEKFGVWPGTYEHVFEKGWLRDFFSMLQDNQDWIEPVTFSEILERVKPRGKIFLPTASYSEMMEWAMPVEGILRFETFKEELIKDGRYEQHKEFVRGGFWRNFLVKYDESNNLHKKMYSVYEYYLKVAENFPFEQQLLAIARNKLLKSQCNCAYWHGIFGGLYLNFLRHALYENMIGCEKILDEIFFHKRRWFSIEEDDFLKTGSKQVIVKNQDMNCYIDPEKGGTVFELDHKPLQFNFLNTMTRYHEAYHEKIKKVLAQNGPVSETRENEIPSIHDQIQVKDRSLGDYLQYDQYRKTAFIDHYLSEPLTLDQMKENSWPEKKPLYDKAYGYSVFTQDIELFYPKKNPWLRKHYYFTPDDSRFMVKWDVTPAKPGYFASELNLGLMVEDSPDRYIEFDRTSKRYPFNSQMKVKNASWMLLKDEYMRYTIKLSFSRQVDILLCPVYTVSLSESGGEKIYQNTSIVFQWPVNKKEPADLTATVYITKDSDTDEQ